MAEVLSNPAAKEILKREFPELMNPFILSVARNMTLAAVLDFANGKIPQEKLERILSELEEL